MHRSATLFTAPLLAHAVLTACGPLPPLPDAAASVTGVESASVAEASPATDCPLPIASTAFESRINYLLPPSDTAWMRVWTTGLFDDGTFVARYERRDMRGQELGSTRYRCDASGLWLLSSEGGGMALSFEPPLPVWSVALPSGDQGGNVRVDEAGSARVMRYGYSFVGQPDAAPNAFANADGLWHQQRFALLVEDATTAWVWEGSSLWGVVDGVAFPARRIVERTVDGATTEEHEEARVLHPFTR